MTSFDPATIRDQFPALALEQDGRPVVYLDGPGGTQVPQRVIDAVVDYYRTMNANDGGAFQTSEATVAMVSEARSAVAVRESTQAAHCGPRALMAVTAAGSSIIRTGEAFGSHRAMASQHWGRHARCGR